MGGSCTKVKKRNKTEKPERTIKRDFTLKKQDMVKIKQRNMRDEYKIIDEIGHEVFASLYKCKSRVSGKSYIAKVFSTNDVDTNASDYFLWESKLLREADHPNIVKIIDIFQDSRNAAIIMEKYKHGDFLDIIKSNSELSEAVIVEYFKQICSAIAYLHSHGITHRNLCPDS